MNSMGIDTGAMNSLELAHSPTARIDPRPRRQTAPGIAPGIAPGTALGTALRLRDGTELARMLNPVMRGELATLGALEMLRGRARTRGLEPLLVALQRTHRENVRQLSALLRVARVTPRSYRPLALWPRRMELFLVQLVSVTETLRLLRSFETELLDACRQLRLELDGPARLAMGALIQRAEDNVFILQAHIARRSGGASREARRMARPLSSLFAGHPHDRMCLRCLLDRPADRAEAGHEAIDHGPKGPYLCAACHGETRHELPLELRERLDHMARGEAEGILLARAGACPSRERARDSL